MFRFLRWLWPFKNGRERGSASVGNPDGNGALCIETATPGEDTRIMETALSNGKRLEEKTRAVSDLLDTEIEETKNGNRGS